jgi:hypothetical protein
MAFGRLIRSRPIGGEIFHFGCQLSSASGGRRVSQRCRFEAFYADEFRRRPSPKPVELSGSLILTWPNADRRGDEIRGVDSAKSERDR